MKITGKTGLARAAAAGRKKLKSARVRIGVGMGTCGIGMGADRVYGALQQQLKKNKVTADLVPVGCFGYCAVEPLVNLALPGKPLVILKEISEADVPAILEAARKKDIGKIPAEKILCKISAWDHLTGKISYGKGLPGVPEWNTLPFYKWQKKLVLRDAGIINPEDLDEYLAVGGYASLAAALTFKDTGKIISELKASGLRGRGGAGFPTAVKWDIMRGIPSDKKYVVCNADEGDPGAYMNRNELESDPHMILEGMALGALAMGADEGIIYIRAEYPLAVARLTGAIAQAKKRGLLGRNIMGSKFSFDLHIVEGAGAFVCGEETAMIASIEGNAGRSRPRPPFPAQKGVWGYPTTINNVETWSNIPVIVGRGGAWFAKTGTAKSTGTKVFSLVGKIKNTGLVELPLGETLDTIVNKIGGGTGMDTAVKAVQTGGPSGGCIPARLFKTPVDFESLAQLGAIMGSGGMVVMDDENCMVDVARYFLSFLVDESCGKCVPCRTGTKLIYRMVTDICDGRGKEVNLVTLKELAGVIQDTSLCALGKTAPNPVLSTLNYFAGEYTAHVEKGTCPAKVCKALYRFRIIPEKCTACGRCKRECPQDAVTGAKKVPHEIVEEKCITCGMCYDVCKFKAIEKI